MCKVVTKLLILTLLELLKLKLLTLTWLMSNKMRTLCLWLKLVLLGIIVLTLLRLGISTFVSTSVSIEASFLIELVL